MRWELNSPQVYEAPLVRRVNSDLHPLTADGAGFSRAAARSREIVFAQKTRRRFLRFSTRSHQSAPAITIG
jgi:hypothetical protein